MHWFDDYDMIRGDFDSRILKAVHNCLHHFVKKNKQNALLHLWYFPFLKHNQDSVFFIYGTKTSLNLEYFDMIPLELCLYTNWAFFERLKELIFAFVIIFI